MDAPVNASPLMQPSSPLTALLRLPKHLIGHTILPQLDVISLCRLTRVRKALKAEIEAEWKRRLHVEFSFPPTARPPPEALIMSVSDDSSAQHSAAVRST